MCELITLPEGGSAIICRGAHTHSDHVCNEDIVVLLLDDNERVPDTSKNREKYADRIRGGSVACSVCFRAAIDNAPYLD